MGTKKMDAVLDRPATEVAPPPASLTSRKQRVDYCHQQIAAHPGKYLLISSDGDRLLAFADDRSPLVELIRSKKEFRGGVFAFSPARASNFLF